jgi:pimeloyl-ACP methyl ester carboxylesterase
LQFACVEVTSISTNPSKELTMLTSLPLRRLRAGIGGVILLVSASLLAACSGGGAGADNAVRAPGVTKPTIVLVHGAWADAAGWNGVAERLQRQGFSVVAHANPLRGLATDSSYLSSVLDTIEGPVVIVGHSYGGAVLTNAATGHPDVKALVYVAAFAPDTGDTIGGLIGMNRGSLIGPDTLVTRPFPGGADGYIKPEAFREAFAGDVPEQAARLMAAEQRPASLGILGEVSDATPAWKTIPSWYMVATNDHTIPPATERFMAKRAGSTTVEVKSSHVAMISHPGAVTDLILTAVRATD